MKAVVAAFNPEKALVGALSVIVQLHRLIVYSTSVCTCAGRGSLCMTERCRCGLSLVTGGTGTAPAGPGPGPASVLVQRPTYHRQHWCCRQPSSGHGEIIAHTTITVSRALTFVPDSAGLYGLDCLSMISCKHQKISAGTSLSLS